MAICLTCGGPVGGIRDQHDCLSECVKILAEEVVDVRLELASVRDVLAQMRAGAIPILDGGRVEYKTKKYSDEIHN